MKWLFLYFMFDISGGNVTPKVKMTIVYPTEAKCQALGEQLAAKLSYSNPNTRSISMCIPESAYREKMEEMKVERLDE